MGYYIDTCIWLNLFKKEEGYDSSMPLWKVAEDFVRQMILDGEKIFYSSVVLRELQIKLNNKYYEEKRIFLKSFIEVNILQEDKINARKLESAYNFEINFYDLIHMLVCKRLNLILVTRDRQLLIIAGENGVVTVKPESRL